VEVLFLLYAVALVAPDNRRYVNEIEPTFEYHLRHDGPDREGAPDWWAVQYRSNPLDTWTTVPRRFRSREDAEAYIERESSRC
jgi:hypothetical protein